MSFKGLKVGFAITGSLCNFEFVFPEIEKLVKEGADVYPIMSPAAATFDSRYGTAESWRNKLMEITGKEIILTIVGAEPLGPKIGMDIMVVAPCTGNSTAKLANAITDTAVLMAVKAHVRNNKPVVLAIATNDALGANAKNIGLLMNMRNMYFVPIGQDNAVGKPKSMVARFDMLLPTIEEALQGRQIQPMLVMY